MVDIENYVSKLTTLLKNQFASRLVYVGLQGSYLRGEANENSDIDIMVVIDNLSVSDLDRYREIIFSIEEPDKSCGFICSKADLANWNSLEICHLLGSTKDCYGQLKQLVPEYTNNDIRTFIKMNINNLYHEICHRYIHAENNHGADCLPFAYKNVFFILQNLYYLKTERFVPSKSELLKLLEGKDFDVLKRSTEINRGIEFDFEGSFELLFSWCQNTLASL